MDGVLMLVVGEVLMGVIDEKKVLYFGVVVIWVGMNLRTEFELMELSSVESFSDDWVGE